MKLAIIGDPHIEKRIAGYNTLNDFNRATKALGRSLARLKCDVAVVLGDLFDNKRPIPNSYERAIWFIQTLKRRVGQVISIEGNHDLGTSKPLQRAFGEDAVFVDTPRIIEVHETSMAFVPYVHDQEAVNSFFDESLIDGVKYFFTHLGVNGAVDSDGHQIHNEVVVPKVSGVQIFNGHIHQQQVVNGNILCVGSFIPTTFSDTAKKGFVVKTI